MRSAVTYIAIIVTAACAALLFTNSKSWCAQTEGPLATLQFTSQKESSDLPEPNHWNPMYWAWPDYARTAFRCDGDPVLRMYLRDNVKWGPSKLTLTFHHVSEGFISAEYDSDSNLGEAVTLEAKDLQFVRSFLEAKVRLMNVDSDVLRWTSASLGAPFLPVNKSVGVVIWLWSVAASEIDASLTQSYKDAVNRFEGNLLQDVTAYRVTTVLKDKDNREYVRVMYALSTQNSDLYVLSRCYFARRSAGR